MTTQPTIAILAGGRSVRMGRDKAFIRFDGETLLERTARLAAGEGRSVVVVGIEPPTEWSMPEVRFLPDEEPGHGGPIVGLATVLASTERPVLLLPCDLPLLQEDLVDWLLYELPEAALQDGTLLQSTHGPEPLLSYYTPEILHLLHERIASEQRSLRRAIESGSLAEITLPPQFEPQLLNMNRPEDERRARSIR